MRSKVFGPSLSNSDISSVSPVLVRHREASQRGIEAGKNPIRI